MAGEAVTPHDFVLTVWDIVLILVASLCFASVHNRVESAPSKDGKEILCEMYFHG